LESLNNQPAKIRADGVAALPSERRDAIDHRRFMGRTPQRLEHQSGVACERFKKRRLSGWVHPDSPCQSVSVKPQMNALACQVQAKPVLRGSFLRDQARLRTNTVPAE
jgi:hypothetical protein